MGCFGSKSDANHEPTAVRGCTDVFWLCLYTAFWLLMIVVAIFSFVYGNPLRLINGYDSFGNTCGVKSNERFSGFPLSGRDTSKEPYLFYLDIKEIRETIKICVRECPGIQLKDSKELHKYSLDSQSNFCRYDFDMNLLLNPQKDAKYFNHLGPCPPFPIYESKPVLHRCVPTDKDAPGKSVRELYGLLNSWDATQQLLSDLYTTWPVVLLLVFIALVFSIILIALMHWLTKLVSWLICIFVAIASIALTIILWWTYYSIKHKVDLKIKYSLLEEFVKNETAIYVLAIIATIVMIIILVIIFFLRSKIGGLAALFEEAGKCMMDLPGLAGPALLAVAALIVFIVFWVTVIICLATANYPGKKSLFSVNQISSNITPIEENTSIGYNTSTDDYKSTMFVEYLEAHWLRNMLWFYIIGLIWTSEFIFACHQLSVAGAVAYWYFQKPTNSPVIHAMGKLVKYHLGSVAKGSLLITIFKIPRLILTYLYTKLKGGEDKGSECAKCCLKCCVCSFWLLEKFIRYLNHNAYTVIAIESVNFCPAAGIAWNAMASNALQVATINGIGDFVLFLGKVAVAAVCCIISVLMLKNREDINYYIAPVILVTVFGFFIAHVVLSLYEMVVDTLFLCVCEDKTINGPNGRWKQSNLAKLVGEEPVSSEEQAMQTVELTPITKQPFSSVIS